MISFSHQLKVGHDVVLSVPIFMMNDFIFCEKSSDVLFHHQAMFHYVSLAISVRVMRRQNGEVFILRSVSDSEFEIRMPNPGSRLHVFAVALLTAKLLSLFMTLKALKLFCAHGACFDNRTAVTPSILEITRRSAKFASVIGVRLKNKFAVALKACGVHGANRISLAFLRQAVKGKYCAIERLRQGVLIPC